MDIDDSGSKGTIYTLVVHDFVSVFLIHINLRIQPCSACGLFFILKLETFGSLPVYDSVSTLQTS